MMDYIKGNLKNWEDKWHKRYTRKNTKKRSL